MEDHAIRAVLGWVLRFTQRRFQNFVGEIGHRTALSFGFMVQRRDQMPFDGR
jgi:hypothetical protein